MVATHRKPRVSNVYKFGAYFLKPNFKKLDSLIFKSFKDYIIFF